MYNCCDLVLVLQSNTMAQMVKAVRTILGFESFGSTLKRPTKSSLDIEIEDDAPKRKPTLEEIDALEVYPLPSLIFIFLNLASLFIFVDKNIQNFFFYWAIIGSVTIPIFREAYASASLIFAHWNSRSLFRNISLWKINKLR